MRKLNLNVLILLSLVGIFSSQSQHIWAQQNTQNNLISRVAVIDLAYVQQNSEIGKLIEKRIGDAREKFISESKVISEQLGLREEELAKKRDSMPAQDFTELAKAFETESEVQRKTYQETIVAQQNIQNQWLTRFSLYVQNISQNYVDNSEFDIILNKSNAIFARKSAIDISQKMVDHLNIEYKKDPKSIEEAIFTPINEAALMPLEENLNIIPTEGTSDEQPK